MLSKIFGELPDMLKQQIIEFVGGDGIYVLSYNYKTKTFTRMFNKAYMKKTLEYKIQNPPVMIISSRYHIQYIRFSPPPKVRDYLLILHDYRTNVNNRIAINPKYRIGITKVNKKYMPEYNSSMSVKEINIPGKGKYMLL